MHYADTRLQLGQRVMSCAILPGLLGRRGFRLINEHSERSIYIKYES